MNVGADNPMMYCRACGRQIHVSAPSCPGCGAIQAQQPGISDRRILPALLLCFFLGYLGVHRFYVGKVGTGVLQILTLGGLGVWVLIDFIMIVTGSFRDIDGNRVALWT